MWAAQKVDLAAGPEAGFLRAGIRGGIAKKAPVSLNIPVCCFGGCVFVVTPDFSGWFRCIRRENRNLFPERRLRLMN
jgi:hypothetical protein